MYDKSVYFCIFFTKFFNMYVFDSNNHKCSVHHVKVHNDITHFSHVGCSLQVIMLSELLFYVHVVIVDNCKKKLNLFSCICFNDDFNLLSHLKAC